MVWRVFRFFLFQLAGAALGRYLPMGDPRNGMLVGIVLAGALWVLVDLRRGMRLLAWLKEGDTGAPVRVASWDTKRTRGSSGSATERRTGSPPT